MINSEQYTAANEGREKCRKKAPNEKQRVLHTADEHGWEEKNVWSKGATATKIKLRLSFRP